MNSLRRNTYFLSDLHLGAAYMGDSHAHQHRVTAFLRSIENDAKAVYLLGDVLDYWFEYRATVPRGYVRFFGQLARMADMGIRIVWFTGNHDIWLFDYLRDEIGMEIVDARGAGIERTIDGKRFFLGHGDDLGRQPVGYRMLRALFHNRVAQRLYAFVPPAWTIPFAHGWSAHSRKSAAGQPEFGLQTRKNLLDAADALCRADAGLDYIVIGHYHVALDEQVSERCRLLILGNWINLSTYACFDGSELKLKEFEPSV